MLTSSSSGAPWAQEVWVQPGRLLGDPFVSANSETPTQAYGVAGEGRAGLRKMEGGGCQGQPKGCWEIPCSSPPSWSWKGSLLPRHLVAHRLLPGTWPEVRLSLPVRGLEMYTATSVCLSFPSVHWRGKNTRATSTCE